MRKMFLQAGLVWLGSTAFGFCVLGQTGGSSMHQQMTNRPHYSLRIENDKVVELSIDGRRIPPDSFSVYDPAIRKLREQAAKDMQQAVLDKEQAEKDMRQVLLDKVQADKDKLSAEQDKLYAERDKVLAEHNKELAELEALHAQKEAAGMEQDIAKIRQEESQTQGELQRAQREMERAKLDLQQAMLDRERAQRDRKLAMEDMEIVQRVIHEAVKDGLAPDENSIESITLNHEEFLINGKKQPEAIHKKYVTAFIVKPGYKVLYHH